MALKVLLIGGPEPDLEALLDELRVEVVASAAQGEAVVPPGRSCDLVIVCDPMSEDYRRLGALLGEAGGTPPVVLLGSGPPVPGEEIVVSSPGALGRLLGLLAKRGAAEDGAGGRSRYPDTVPVGLYRVSMDGVLQDGNDALARLLGYESLEEIIGRQVSSFYVRQPDRDRWIQRLLDTRVLSGAELELRTRDGRTVWVRDTARVVFEDGRPVAVEGVLEEVTAERELRLQIQRGKLEWERTFDAVPDAVLLLNGVGAVARANRAAAVVAGVDHPVRIVGRPVGEVLPSVGPLVAGNEGRSNSMILGVRDGMPGEFLVTVQGFPGPAGQGEWRVIILRDVGDLRRLEAEAEEAGRRFQLLAETSLAGVYIVEGDLFVYVNPAFAEFIGYRPEEIMGKLGPEDLIWPEDWPMARENLRRRFSGEVRDVRYELRLKHRDGRPVSTLAWGRRVEAEGRVYIMGTLLDISKEREAIRSMARQERMAAVGRLAAGIAHDFNNILQAISLNAELLLDVRGLPEGARRRIDTVRKQVKKGSSIVRQILDYARVSETRPRAVEMGALVKETLRLLSVSIREDIAVSVDVSPGEHWVVADPVKLDQVISNLVINAVDAMPRGGELRVKLRSFASEAGDPPTTGTWRALTVADTGEGIDEATRRRIFEPFFTTKDPAKGTGLGLAQVWGIVNRYGGSVTVDSTEGAGTEFTVYLPAAENPGRAETAGEGQGESSWRELGAGRRVLLVEDQTEVRKVVSEGLAAMGFEVFQAEDGVAALKLMDRAGQSPDLVITDLVMPRMGGRELTEALRGRGWTGPVLYMTGYPDAPGSGAGEPGLPPGSWLYKPVTMGTLARAVEEVLSRETGG